MRIVSFIQKKQIPKRRRAIREYQEKRRSRKFLLFSFIFLIILLIGGFFYLIFFSSIFKIQFIFFEIKDHPLVRIDENELKGEVNKILSKKFYFLTLDNIFFFPKKEISNFLGQDKKIEEFKIKRILPQEMKIKISTWQPEAVFCSLKGEYFLLNKNGSIIKNIGEGEVILSGLPIIYDKTKGGERSFPFLSIFDFFKKTSGADFKILRVEISEEKKVLEYQAITTEGWKIYFEPKVGLREQVNNLFLVLREKFSDRTKLEYIDLRFGNRVFYK